MKTAIPVATEKLTIKQQRAARRDAFYRLNVDLNKSVKGLIGSLGADQMEEILTAYMTLMSKEAPEGEAVIEVDVKVMQQMALLASQSLSRQLIDRYK